MKQKLDLSGNIESFVQAVIPMNSAREVWKLWVKELAKYKDKTENTRKLYTSKYRSAIRAIDPDHIALSTVKLPKNKSAKISEEYTRSVAMSNKKLIKFNRWKEYINIAKSIVSSDRPTEIGTSLIALTGRRPYEIFCSGEFKLHQPHPNVTSRLLLEFRGQAKMKDSRDDEFYVIPVFHDANEIMQAYNLLRSLRPDLIGIDGKDFNQRMQNTLTNKCREHFTRVWPAEESVTPGKLRPIYAEIAWRFFRKHFPAHSKSGFFSEILGHSEFDVTTSLSYMDYYIDNKEDAYEAVKDAQAELQTDGRSTSHAEPDSALEDAKKNDETDDITPPEPGN